MVALKNILFPTDFSDCSKYASSFAVSFAREYGAKLHVLHVIEMPHKGAEAIFAKISKQDLAARAKDLATQEIETTASPQTLEKLDYEVTCVTGKPFLEIINFAKVNRIDMIVMGTHGLSSLEVALIGSVAEKVVRKAPCPVFSVRMPGHRFVMPAIG